MKLLVITILATRIWAISLFYIFASNPKFIQSFIDDSLHHYQVGLILLILSFILMKFKFIKTSIPTLIGLGIFLEEWPIVLEDLGFNTNYLYHSGLDLLIIISVVITIYTIYRKFYLKNISR